MSKLTNAAALAHQSARRQLLSGFASVVGALALGSTNAHASSDDPISHSAESIHQEVAFKATRKRVYDALTDEKQFDQVVHLSDAIKTLIHPGAPPTRISTAPGGTFSTFGGLIVGMLIELVPSERIVQAWRPAYWNPGVFSLVKFTLADDTENGTKLTLDHKAFPDGDALSLLEGWNKNYWQPLTKFLAQP